MKEKKEKFNFPHTTYKKIDHAYIPTKVYVSMKQDGYEACNSVVNIGDMVTEGNILAIGNNASTPIYSPISGIVSAFKTSSMPDGTTAECVVIDLDGSFIFEGKKQPSLEWKEFTIKNLLSQIKSRGIINTFDNSYYSLESQLSDQKSVSKTLGVRLFDFDPTTSVDTVVSQLYKKEVLEGAHICAKAMNADGILFFHSDNWTIPTSSELKNFFEDVPNSFIKTKSNLYPCGSRRELQNLIKKHIQSIPERISTDIQVYIDATTALSVYRGICLALPVMETIVEINGSALHESRIFFAKIGTPIRKLLEECGGTEKIPAKIVMNGLIKGVAAAEIDIPVTKYLKSVTFLSADSVPDQKESLCIHCGYCRKACPVGILPDILYNHYRYEISVPREIISSVHLCDMCALCNVTCPARLPLFQIISLVKDTNDASKI